MGSDLWEIQTHIHKTYASLAFLNQIGAYLGNILGTVTSVFIILRRIRVFLQAFPNYW
jgi:hypothetical protein